MPYKYSCLKSHKLKPGKRNYCASSLANSYIKKKKTQPNIQGQGWLNKVVSADRLGKLCSSELPQGASDDAPLDSAECDQTIGSRSSTLLSAVLQAPSDIGEEKNNNY